MRKWLGRKNSYSHDHFLLLCLFIVPPRKKTRHLAAPLSSRPRARQRIVISFYPQAAPLPGRARKMCAKHKAEAILCQMCSKCARCAQLQCHTFAQFWSTMQNVCSKSDSQLCQICQACELHKNVLNFSLLGTQRRDTTALEEAFEFKAR